MRQKRAQRSLSRGFSTGNRSAVGTNFKPIFGAKRGLYWFLAHWNEDLFTKSPTSLDVA